ncbi:ParB/RepB/Spo0J family partition protein [Methylocella silvestris]|uniref:ParB-like N-terminal domain-containing protein n=1 Tax=Methylocella silvestris TaxID=199596 RepID=A0A2J7TJT8_METSI|nr:ParB/RepB/Spo0J family partition protein [Methylocella silvestris]PNG27032.1 hypothetical protein CR492_04830 [Methylocella silvestris]
MTTSLALEARAIRLDQIAGVSDLNPRLADENEIAELAASIFAVGQLQDLMVEPAELKGHYLILDGQRRWRAMHHLVESGSWPPDAPINVTVVDYGDEALRREKALAANTMRRALHPVDEYEAFAELAAAGVVEERIARDFGLDVRRVRQRLALGRLSPKIRAAWREGIIDATIAQAYTAGATHEAQDAVFDAMGTAPSVYAIKSSLRADTLREDAAETTYIGADAYLAAGGRIEEQLFDDGATWLDGGLAKRLAREKLMAEAEAIAAAEGWGFVVFQPEPNAGEYIVSDYELEYSPEEQKRVDELEECDAATTEEIEAGEAEKEAIDLRALLRQIPAAKRGSLGIVADLSHYGEPVFYRGWKQQPPEDAAVEDNHHSDSARAATRAEKGAAAASSPAAAPPKKTPKALREVLDASLDGAFAACIGTRPDLALMLAVAKFGPTYEGGASGCIQLSGGLSAYADDHVSELLGKLTGKAFDRALALCADAPLADLTAAFCEIVARSISVANRPHEDMPIGKCEPIAKALAARGAPLAERLNEALDREAYFAASKKTCVAVAEQLETPAINSVGKKALIASAVAADAAKKKWLPAPLSDWAALTATSPEAPRAEPQDKPLAQAMLEAIDADEQARRDKITRVCDFQAGAPLFGKFMIERVEVKDGAECKASDLRAAFLATASPTATARPLSAPEIGAMLKKLGVASKRKKDGVFYLGLALKDEAA